MLGADRTEAPGGIDFSAARLRLEAFGGILLAPFPSTVESCSLLS